jgi:hypothetical protein
MSNLKPFSGNTKTIFFAILGAISVAVFGPPALFSLLGVLGLVYLSRYIPDEWIDVIYDNHGESGVRLLAWIILFVSFCTFLLFFSIPGLG